MTINPSIIQSAADSALRRIRRDLEYASLPDYVQYASMIERDTMWSAWEKALQDCRGYYFGDRVENAEAAVAACIRAGLDRQDGIRYSNDCYWLLLENQQYCIFRELSGFTAMPLAAIHSSRGGRLAIGLSREAFADFLYSFDRMVPGISEAASRTCEEVRSILIGNDRERKVRQILETARRAGGKA